MLKSKWSKYIFRLVLIFLLQLLIKGFDHSFSGLLDFSNRSIFFFFGFTIYWMVIWTAFSWSINYIEKKYFKRIKELWLYIFLSVTTLILSVGVAILFNFLYRSMDIWLFNNAEIWKLTPFPHPDLIYPLVLLSLLIFIIDRFVNFADQLKSAELYASHLEQIAIQSKYEALKNQVDPHFFFNSLSVLSSIVHTDPDLSEKYIYNLSKLYRYTLESKRANVVSLDEELEMLNSYIFLIKIRFPDSLIFHIDLNTVKKEQLGIHSNCLQLLVENAIKHNSFKEDDPLIIEIFKEADFFVVRNPIRKRKQLNPSTGIGLENIRKRYELYDNKKIVIDKSNGYFTVKLPIIEIRQDEDHTR